MVFPKGFEYAATYAVGDETEEEFILKDIKANTNVMFIIKEQQGNVDGIRLDVFQQDGKAIARNQLGQKYYKEVTVKCTEDGDVKLKVTYKGTRRPAVISVGTKASLLPAKPSN